MLALASIALPVAVLAIACGSDSGKKGNGSDDGTGGLGSVTGTTPTPGTGKGGIVPISKEVWDNAMSQACNGWSNETENLPAKIEMVVDVSSSMKETTQGSSKNKWEQTRAAITEAFVGVPGGDRGLPDDVGVGLLFYPNVQTDSSSEPKDVTSCVKTSAAIPIAPLGADAAGSQRQKLRDALTSIQLGPSGTPTWDALDYGTRVELLQKGASVGGNPFVVLITDGMPTLESQCRNESGSLSDVDPQPIVELIDGFYKKNGVKTFLIGSPGSEKGRAWMSQAAVLGQTASKGCNVKGPNYCHMDLTTSEDFGASLTAALKAIAGSVMSCEYRILGKSADDSQVVDPTLTVVLASFSTGERVLIGRDDTPEDCTQGWYVNEETDQIVFCSETCKKVQSDAGALVNVNFGCGEGVILQ
jgi:hypothetical protein